MNIQAPARMDKQAFIAWMAANEGRYELVEGRVVMMTGVSRAHAIVVMNIAALLRSQLDSETWTVIAEFGLDAGPQTLRYPDIVVDRAGGGLRDYTATVPVLLVEVLSPSTAAIDLRDKASEYLRLPSLAAYIAFAQTEPKAWVWSRSAEEGFPPQPSIYEGIDSVVSVEPLNLTLPFRDAYAGVWPR